MLALLCLILGMVSAFTFLNIFVGRDFVRAVERR
jgi:hypothetical protein